jgi:hypothetical protein
MQVSGGKMKRELRRWKLGGLKRKTVSSVDETKIKVAKHHKRAAWNATEMRVADWLLRITTTSATLRAGPSCTDHRCD